MTQRLNIHLSTDRVTGERQIDFDPVDGDHIPVDPGEWSGFTVDGHGLRALLRHEIRHRIAPAEVWESYLDSNRTGERLDVQIGHADVSDDGEIESIEIAHDHPNTINWDQ